MAIRKYNGIEYDTDRDYMAEIKLAREAGDNDYAAKLEQKRNAKIDGEGITQYSKTNLYSNSAPAVSGAASKVSPTAVKAPGTSRSSEINRILSNLQSNKFSYDAQKDPIYKQYSEAVNKSAERATSDTLSKAAKMTGGMPSTYAITAAQGAGDVYRQKTDEIIPELYQLAYSMYADGRNDDYTRINLLRELDNDEYNRFDNERRYTDDRWDNALDRNTDELRYADDIELKIADLTGDYKGNRTLQGAESDQRIAESNWNMGYKERELAHNIEADNAKLYGYGPNGEETLEKTDSNRNYELDKGALLGYIDGAPTLDRIQLSGYDENGNNTLSRDELEQREAEANMDYGISMMKAASGGGSGGSSNYGAADATALQKIYTAFQEEGQEAGQKMLYSYVIDGTVDPEVYYTYEAMVKGKSSVPFAFQYVDDSSSVSIGNAIKQALVNGDFDAAYYALNHLDSWNKTGALSTGEVISYRDKLNKFLGVEDDELDLFGMTKYR